MKKIIINGKTYKYGGWAECAYEFMVSSNELNPETKLTEDALTQIIKKSKELRGNDLLSLIAKKMEIYLCNYDPYKHGYIPEITAEYMKEFANSDIMQANEKILTNIIEAIQKLYLHLKIPFNSELDKSTDSELDKSTDSELDKSTDSELDKSTDSELDKFTDSELDKSTDDILKIINNIENLQILLINLINLSI